VGLTRNLGKAVHVTSRPLQQTFDWAEGATPEIGCVVAGIADGNEVFGIYGGEKGGKKLIEDFGVIHQADSITSAHTFSAGSEEFVRKYQTAVNEYGESPTYESIVSAVGEMYSSGQVRRNESNEWILNEAVLNAALALHLPAEAGEA